MTVDDGLQPGSAERAAEVSAACRPASGSTRCAPSRCGSRRPARAGGRGCGPDGQVRGAAGRGPPVRGRRGLALATPWTTRPRPSCSGSRADPAAGRWPGCPPAGAYTAGRAGRAPGHHQCRLRRAAPAPWQDPHNHDFRFARARVRHQAMPALEDALGPGVAEALARTASQLRADAECLDDLAFAESAQLRGGCSDPAGLAAGWLRELPAAIRTRVLRDAAIMAGCPHGALTAGHVERIGALVTGWHGQRWVDLPGGVRAWRRDGKVWFTGTNTGRL